MYESAYGGFTAVTPRERGRTTPDGVRRPPSGRVTSNRRMQLPAQNSVTGPASDVYTCLAIRPDEKTFTLSSSMRGSKVD
jgi:hypothetical protein